MRPDSRAGREAGISGGALTLHTRIAYALPAFALAVVGIPVYVYLPKFYTDVVGVPVGALGVVLLGARVFDALTDPAIGVLSDRTRLPWGRRRPYIMGGSLLLALSIAFLFNPPSGSVRAATLWFTAGIFAVFLFWTLVVVPYESLGPEISFSYHDRTALFGLRDAVFIAGTLAAAASPAMIRWVFGLPPGPEGDRETFFRMSALYGPLVIVFSAWCALTIREAPAGRPLPAPRLADLRLLIENRPFRILILAYTVSAIGSNLPATLLLYYVGYVLQSDLADLFLLLYLATGIAFMPLWIRLSRKMGKKRAWIRAMALNSGVFFWVFFLSAGDELAYGVLVFLSGIGFGGTLGIPASLQADVIDYDELLIGQRREGLHLGLMSVARKSAAAVGVGLGLALLGRAGYEPNVQQSDAVLLTLRVLYALVPSLFSLAALVAALGYPIDEGVHAAIRQGITRRRTCRDAWDPIRQLTIDAARLPLPECALETAAAPEPRGKGMET